MSCQSRSLNVPISLFIGYKQFVNTSSASVASEIWAGERESFSGRICFLELSKQQGSFLPTDSLLPYCRSIMPSDVKSTEDSLN